MVEVSGRTYPVDVLVFLPGQGTATVFADRIEIQAPHRKRCFSMAVTATDVHSLINPGIAKNLHDQAWDVADRLVLAMRKGVR